MIPLSWFNFHVLLLSICCFVIDIEGVVRSAPPNQQRGSHLQLQARVTRSDVDPVYGRQLQVQLELSNFSRAWTASQDRGLFFILS